MTALTMYEEPFPKPDSVVLTESDEPCCEAIARGIAFACTREPGHAGDHQACDSDDLMVASWPQEATS